MRARVPLLLLLPLLCVLTLALAILKDYLEMVHAQLGELEERLVYLTSLFHIEGQILRQGDSNSGGNTPLIVHRTIRIPGSGGSRQFCIEGEFDTDQTEDRECLYKMGEFLNALEAKLEREEDQQSEEANIQNTGNVAGYLKL